MKLAVYSSRMGKRRRGRPKGSGGLAAVLDSGQIKRLLQVAQQMDRTSYRVQIALLFSHEIGLRASEISKLSLGDIYTEEGRVRDRLQVNGVRGSRILPLRSIKLRAALADHYEKSFHDRRVNDLTPLVRSQRGGAMAPASLARLMTCVYRAAGIRSGSSRSGRRTLRASFEEFGLI